MSRRFQFLALRVETLLDLGIKSWFISQPEAGQGLVGAAVMARCPCPTQLQPCHPAQLPVPRQGRKGLGRIKVLLPEFREPPLPRG